MTLVKTSERALRSACFKCGDTTPAWKATDTETGEQNVRVNSHDNTPHGILSRHVCGTPVETPAETPKAPEIGDVPEASRAPEVPATADSGRMAALEQLIGILTATPQIDRSQVETIAREVATEIVGDMVMPIKTIYKRSADDTAPNEKVGGHPKLPTVVTLLNLGLNVYAFGPAGTGKTTIARHAAEVMGLEFGMYSFAQQTPVSQLVGFMAANGNYVTSEFRERFEKGGLFLADEFDSCNPAVAIVLNSAIANGVCSFPDGMVQAHPDFHFMAAGNTNLMGASRQYNARSKTDAATLDRLTFVEIEQDPTVERAMCEAVADAATVGKVLDFAAKVRAAIKTEGADVVVSPRATEALCKMLSEGIPWDMAVEMGVRKGMDAPLWKKLTA